MCALSSLGATHICINKHNAIDTKKKVTFMSITSTKTYEVGETLVCERKSSDGYKTILLSTIFQGSRDLNLYI